MSVGNGFNYSLPSPLQGRPISTEEAERRLLERLARTQAEYRDALWGLAVFYSRTGRQPAALGALERLLAFTQDPEEQAGVTLALGQLMEQIGDYEAAIGFYRRGLALEPASTPTWYLINNNLGYCLNHFERFQEAEACCRSAIQIDPVRHNAYKNLGVARAGLGQYAEAAQLFIQATRAQAADGRALGLLEQLYAEQPQIALEIPDIERQIQQCREAVQAVEQLRGQDPNRPG